MTPARYKTRMTELLGIRHPILCGGLMYLADANYVAAVVNAGAMGFITAKTFPDPGDFRVELQRCAELTGGKPFGVNLYYSPRPEANEETRSQSNLWFCQSPKGYQIPSKTLT